MKQRIVSLLMTVTLLLSLVVSPVAAASATDAFNPNANDTVYAIAVQSNGQVVLGGALYPTGGRSA